MKICFWVSHIATIGGVQRVTALLANELVRYHNITIITNDEKTDVDKNIYSINPQIHLIYQSINLDISKRLSFPKKVIKRINKWTGFFNYGKLTELASCVYFPQKYRERIVKYFNELNFDIIIGVQGYNSLILAIVADEINAKTIGWQHNSFEAYFRTPNAYFWNQDCLFRRYLPRLDEYVVLNEIDKRKIDDYFQIKSRYLYNPKSFTSNEKCHCENKTFIAAGRFTRAKGFDILIDALNYFVKQNKEWNVILVGDGELRKDIEKRITQYNLQGRIKLTGYIDNIKDYFLKSSVLLLPSRWEGMPMIILEALEMGCPVVSFDIDAIRPLITDRTEGLVVHGDYIKFAQAMLEMASDYELRRQLSKNAIQKSKEFSLAIIIPQWLDLFECIKEGKV